MRLLKHHGAGTIQIQNLVTLVLYPTIGSNNHLSSLTPTTSGGGTSGGSALPMVVRRQRDRSVGAVSLRNESSSVHDDALDIKKNNTHSFDDLRKLSVSGQRHPNRTRHSQSVRSVNTSAAKKHTYSLFYFVSLNTVQFQ